MRDVTFPTVLSGKVYNITFFYCNDSSDSTTGALFVIGKKKEMLSNNFTGSLNHCLKLEDRKFLMNL